MFDAVRDDFRVEVCDRDPRPLLTEVDTAEQTGTRVKAQPPGRPSAGGDKIVSPSQQTHVEQGIQPLTDR
jgi:hypothetical protein